MREASMQICLFDIDGTLLNTLGAGRAAMEAALESEFGAGGPAEGISTAGRTDRAIVLDLFAYHGIEPDDGNWSRFLRAYLQQLPGHLAMRAGLVFPGVRELLEQLARRDNVAVGLLTGNFRKGAGIKLQHYELYGHFGFGGFGDHHHDRDDVAREAIRQVEKRFNGEVSPERIWVIGDTPADVQCGRAVGARVVAVGTGVHPGEDLRAAGPDYFFEDFSDPGSLLSLLV